MLVADGFRAKRTMCSTLQSYWFIKSESLGKVGIGLPVQVSDNLAILVDGSGSSFPPTGCSFDVGGFKATATMRRAAQQHSIIGAGGCNGVRAIATAFP